MSEIDWQAEATLHRSDDGAGLLYEFKALRHGELVDLVDFVASLPAAERTRYAIEKSGDHRLDVAEIMELAARSDFPR